MAGSEQEIEKIIAMLDGAVSDGVGRIKVKIDEEKEDRIQVEKSFGTCGMGSDDGNCDIIISEEE